MAGDYPPAAFPGGAAGLRRPLLYAPVAVGEEVGRVEYYLNGRKLAETTLLAAEGTQRAQVTEQPDQPQSWWEKFLSWLGLG